MDSPLPRILQMLFWGGIAAVLYFTLRPPGQVVPGWDKLQHMMSFGTLMLLAAIAYPRARLSGLTATLMGLGAAIELIQPVVGRSDDIRDWLADAAGILVALLLVVTARALFGRERDAVG